MDRTDEPNQPQKEARAGIPTWQMARRTGSGVGADPEAGGVWRLQAGCGPRLRSRQEAACAGGGLPPWPRAVPALGLSGPEPPCGGWNGKSLLGAGEHWAYANVPGQAQGQWVIVI